MCNDIASKIEILPTLIHLTNGPVIRKVFLDIRVWVILDYLKGHSLHYHIPATWLSVCTAIRS